MKTDCIFYKENKGYKECGTRNQIMGLNCIDNICSGCTKYYNNMIDYVKGLSNKRNKNNR